MICGNNMNVLLFLLFMLGDGITIKYITNSFFSSRTSWLSYECQNRLNWLMARGMKAMPGHTIMEKFGK